MIDLTLDEEDGESNNVKTVVHKPKISEVVDGIEIGAKAYHIIAVENAIKTGTPIILDTTRLNDNHRMLFAWFLPKSFPFQCMRILDFLLGSALNKRTFYDAPKVVSSLVNVLCKRHNPPTEEIINQSEIILRKVCGTINLGEMVPVSYAGSPYDSDYAAFTKIRDIYNFPPLIASFRYTRL